MDSKLNFWWDMNVRVCAEDLFPLLRICPFCRMSMVSGKCIFNNIECSEDNCDVVGKELLEWLEGGCE